MMPYTKGVNMSKTKSKVDLKPFNKYYYYEKAVQNPENEVEFFNEKYEEIRGKEPKTLREDFCGTGAISCEWVKQGEEYQSWGIDLDPEPIEYGKEFHLGSLDKEEQKRVHYILDDVMKAQTPKTDVIFAFNFSYFIFKKRSELIKYFTSVKNSLKDDGVFFIDLFGGPDSQTVMTDEIKHPGFKYFWDCQYFNAINNDCRFAIHFKRKGEKKRKDVFVYEWRMWGMRELRDILEEVGFSQTIGYWEGEDEDGDGDGNFFECEDADNCDAWVTYIAAIK
tara:strand:- start:6121 stop:6957 length:837 start_codon:yes stop_codon:yes gene_type:complete